MRNAIISNRRSFGFRLALMVSTGAIGACTSALSSTSAATSAAGACEPQPAPTTSAPAFQVVSIRGKLATLPNLSDASPRPAQGSEIEGRIDAFASPIPPSGSHAEIYLKAFPTEEFDADVVDVAPVRRGWYTAAVRLRHADRRLAAEAPFEGRIVLAAAPRNPPAPSANDEIACQGTP